ncbi:unnamed protein product [Moneuplotes crassus]|uniref:Uncharacterized protein n=1 Tax=Euplotes crassus TaxID=5936 RepID=A0AAD2D9B0_EUPCR|nr:unnamed protein product [Moneuplotes crassus]
MIGKLFEADKVCTDVCREISDKEPTGQEDSDSVIDNLTILKSIVVTSIPPIAGLLFELLVQVVNLIFVGNLNNPAALGGVGLANMLLNVVCFSIGMGLNGAIDTLVSQAYGNHKYYLCGCYLNRGRIIQAMFFIPEVIILLFTKEILILLAQEEDAADYGRTYVLILLLGIFTMTQFETVRRYLQGMEIFSLIMCIQCVTMVIHITMCYILVFTYELGVEGTSIATCITYWLNLLIITGCITFREGVVPEGSWLFFNNECIKGLWEFLKVWNHSNLNALTCRVVFCIQFKVGFLEVNELAVNVVLFNTLAVLFVIPNGISFTISALVGNSMGKGNPPKEKCHYLTAIHLALVIFLREDIAFIYTQEPNVVKLVVSNLPYFSLMMFFDDLQAVTSGTVRAIGYQDYGSWLALVGFWVFSAPLAYIFSHVVGLRLVGIWLGVPVGTLFFTISYNLTCTFVHQKTYQTPSNSDSPTNNQIPKSPLLPHNPPSPNLS